MAKKKKVTALAASVVVVVGSVVGCSILGGENEDVPKYNKPPSNEVEVLDKEEIVELPKEEDEQAEEEILEEDLVFEDEEETGKKSEEKKAVATKKEEKKGNLSLSVLQKPVAQASTIQKPTIKKAPGTSQVASVQKPEVPSKQPSTGTKPVETPKNEGTTGGNTGNVTPPNNEEIPGGSKPGTGGDIETGNPDKEPEKPEDITEVKSETVTKELAFKTVHEDDVALPKGQTKVKQEGVNGKEVITYEVTYVNGKKTNSQEIDRTVTEAVDEIILVGTQDVVEVKQETTETKVPFNSVKEEDPALEKGQTKVKQVGVNGKEVITYEVTYVNGKKTESTEVSRDVTEPVDEIILVGTKVTEVKVETTETDLLFETVTEEDPTLEQGKTKVKQKGVNGKEVVTYEVTYVNGKKTDSKEVNREVTVKPVDEIILEGTKVTQVKEETKVTNIPYKVEEKEDYDLEAGKTKVVQKGVKGKAEVTYSVTYVNGKEVSRKETGREVLEEPVTEIVHIGMKNSVVKEETTENVLKYKTVKENDPTLEKGKTKVKRKGVNGKEIITYSVAYVNGKEVSRVETGREVIKAVDEIILVGTKVTEVKTETTENVVPYKSVTEEDPTLEKGKTKVKQVGVNGKEVVTYEVTYVNGKEESKKEIAREVTIKPVEEIILVGTKVTEVKQETTETVVPFKSVTEEDPTLEKGKTKVKQAGVNGKEVIIYEVTYVNGKEESKKEIAREVTVQPVDEIILVGTKVTEVKQETTEHVVPFKSVQEEDPTLEKGKTKVKQVGVKGKEVITYEVTYVNGKEESKKEVKREVTLQPVDEIILVGTKEVEEDLVAQFEARVIELVNIERGKIGAPPLQGSTVAGRLAREHSQYMSDKGSLEHGDFDTNLKNAGVKFVRAGENAAVGARSPEDVVQMWMNSDGHRANILYWNYTHLGVGFVAEGSYWTQIFYQEN